MAGKVLVANVATQRGCKAESWEITGSSDQDCMGSCVLARLLCEFDRRELGGVRIGVPCKTWSVARMRQPIRNYSWVVWGLDGLSGADFERVKEGNRQARWAARVFTKLAVLGCPIAIENPSTSLLWSTPVFRCLFRRFQHVDFDFCAFGTPYRKRIRILFATWKLQSLAVKKCCGKDVFCTFSGQKYLELVGGIQTKPAGEYPSRFVRFVIECLGRSVG